jgi:hypothetical protein
MYVVEGCMYCLTKKYLIITTLRDMHLYHRVPPLPKHRVNCSRIEHTYLEVKVSMYISDFCSKYCVKDPSTIQVKNHLSKPNRIEAILGIFCFPGCP